MIHIRAIYYAERAPRPRCDTAALQNARETVRRQLLDDKLERQWDAKLPRKLADRNHFLQHGEKS